MGVKSCCRYVGNCIELCVMFYVAALFLQLPLLHQFIYSEISKRYDFMYSYHNQDSCKQQSLNDTVKAKLKMVQNEAASYQMGIVLCNYIPSVLVCIFLGSWSDRIGRKPLLFLSIIGGFIETSLFIAVIFFGLPLWCIFIAAFLNGIGGFFTGVLIGSQTYIADITTPEKRTERLGIFDGTVFVTAMASCFPSGYILDQLGFLKSFICAWACLAASIMVLLLLLKESLSDHVKNQKLMGNSSCSHLINIYQTVKRSRPNGWKLKFSYPALIILQMTQQGMATVFTLYLLNKPLCLDSKHVGYFIGIRYMITGVGTGIGIRLLLKYISEQWVMLIGFISQIASMCLLAFAGNISLAYISCLLNIFGGISSPVLRGIISKSVEENEQGAMLSFSASLEMFFTMVGGIMFSAVYKTVVTQTDFTGLIFLFDAALIIIPFIIATVLAFKLKQQRFGYRTIEIPVNDSEENENNAVIQ